MSPPRDRHDTDEDLLEHAERAAEHVGYKSPPMPRRFQPGKSGNPAGRPRKPAAAAGAAATPSPTSVHIGLTPTRRAIIEGAERQITAREGDKIIQISTREGILRGREQSALKGNRLSTRDVLADYKEIEDALAREKAARFEFWLTYAIDKTILLDNAKARGETLPKILPRPDQMEFSEAKQEVAFLGALDEKHERQLLLVRRRSHYQLMRHHYQERLTTKQGSPTPKGHLTFYYMIHYLLELCLPPAFRTSEAEVISVAMRWTLDATLAELELAIRAEHFILNNELIDQVHVFPTVGIQDLRTRYPAAVRRKADEMMNSYTPVDPAVEEYEKYGTGRLAITLEDALTRRLGQRQRGRPRK